MFGPTFVAVKETSALDCMWQIEGAAEFYMKHWRQTKKLLNLPLRTRLTFMGNTPLQDLQKNYYIY